MGKHLMLDCASCEREAGRDADAIRAFCEDLMASIGMVAYGSLASRISPRTCRRPGILWCS